MPTHCPLTVHFLAYPGEEINELGACGIGEIGLAGIATTQQEFMFANCQSKLRI
jgi:CO/xanthine dehydrogenase Mo-binding subunit